MGAGNTSIAALLTADRLRAELDLLEKMEKAYKSFKKAQKANKQTNNQQTVAGFTQIFPIFFFIWSRGPGH